MIAAGIGCKRGVTVGAVLAAIRQALDQFNVAPQTLAALATLVSKADEPAIIGAANALSLKIITVEDEALKAAESRLLSHSVRSLAASGSPSVSEAAALAAAGEGSRLLGPRIALGNVTCALAASEGTP